MNAIIKNGRVIDPANGVDETRDVYISDAHITAEPPANARVIDAAGLWVVPGLIDLHTHLREPGFEHKETIATGARAAAAGGFATICAMPNTNPVTDSGVMVEYIIMKANREACVNVLPIGALTRGQEGREMAEIGRMAKAGAAALSEDGKSVANAGLMRSCMAYAKMFGLPIFDHCEDPALSGGCLNAGAAATRLGLPGISASSEEVIIARDIILARETGAKLHICHVSTAGGVRLLREAKARGEQVTAEATPHHFTLSDADVTSYDANFKMAPPLRSPEDAAAIKAALADGVISCIATDHAPHHADEKPLEFDKAANGIVGLETAVPLGYTELVLPGLLSPSAWIAAMTINPARVLGIDRGALSPGSPADITLIDPAADYAIDASTFAGKSRNTPFMGRRVRARVTQTIVNGRVVYPF